MLCSAFAPFKEAALARSVAELSAAFREVACPLREVTCSDERASTFMPGNSAKANEGGID
jgi:hypothetical protein